MASAVGKCTGNADGTQSIQPVGILHAFPLRRGRPDGIRPLEGYLVNDLAYLQNFGFRYILTAHEPGGILLFLGGRRGKLPVIHVMEQRRQRHDFQVGVFHLGNFHRGSVNTHGMKKVMSAEIVLENLFSFFNLIFYVIAGFLIAVGSFEELVFLLVVGANTAIGIIQELHSKKKLDELSLLSAPKATVIRDGTEQTIPTAQLVQDDRILLVRERDGRWALPGGWCDYDLSPAENVAKEAREEAGLEVVAKMLIAVQDRDRHNTPPYAYGVVKMFFLCEAKGGHFERNIETTESGYFAEDAIPTLAEEKCDLEQVRMCFAAMRSGDWKTLFE